MLGVLGGRVGGRRSEQGIRQSKCLGPPFLVAKTCVFPRAVCPDEALGSCGPSRNGLRPSSGQRPMSLREEKGAICPHTHLPRDAGRGPWPCLPGPLAASLLNTRIPDLSFVPGTPGALSLISVLVLFLPQGPPLIATAAGMISKGEEGSFPILLARLHWCRVGGGGEG